MAIYVTRELEVDAEQFCIFTQNGKQAFIDIFNIKFPVYYENEKPYVLVPNIFGSKIEQLRANNLDYILCWNGRCEFEVLSPNEFDKRYRIKK